MPRSNPAEDGDVVPASVPRARAVQQTPGDVDQFGAAVLRGALDDADAEHPDRVEQHPTATG